MWGAPTLRVGVREFFWNFQVKLCRVLCIFVAKKQKLGLIDPLGVKGVKRMGLEI